MRERHHPRLCGSCQAPLARQEDTCWRCGARWAAEDAPRTALYVIAAHDAGSPPPPIPAVVAAAVTAEAAAPLRRAAARG